MYNVKVTALYFVNYALGQGVGLKNVVVQITHLMIQQHQTKQAFLSELTINHMFRHILDALHTTYYK